MGGILRHHHFLYKFILHKAYLYMFYLSKCLHYKFIQYKVFLKLHIEIRIRRVSVSGLKVRRPMFGCRNL